MIDVKKLAENTFAWRALYVEDDESVREETTQLLSNFFKQLTVASNGKEGLEFYQNGEFEIVITDIHMPMMNGLEMLQTIKKINRDQSAIVISAHDESHILMELVNLGVDHFILKPMIPANFLSVLYRVFHEFTKRKSMLSKMEQDGRSLEMMEHGLFKYQTLEDVDNLARMLSSIGPDPSKVLQGLLELLINSVEHGNLGLSYDEKTEFINQTNLEEEIKRRLELPENKNKYATIEFTKNESEIKLLIQDQGSGFDFKKYLHFDQNRLFDNHGRGIAMSKSHFFDELIYSGTGNTVEITINLPT